MAARKTVQIQLEKVLSLSKNAGWSAATLAKRVGKHERWFSEIKRNKNLPSPEEAARMCVLLQTTPEEILVEQADIDLVNSLLEQEREKSAKKERPAEGGTLSGAKQKLLDSVDGMSDEWIMNLVGLIEDAKKNSGE